MCLWNPLHSGTPAAAFECIPIIGRIIEDGKNGYLAKPEDVSGLAEAMRLFFQT